MIAQHRVRRLALQALCCLDVQGLKVLDLLDEFVADNDEPADNVSAARELVRKVWENLGRIDEILARHAKRWDLRRLALVDRNVLRLAAHELRETDISHKIIITEAMKLAQEFSTAESARFVNGVLDPVARELRPQAQHAPPEPPTG